MTKDMNELIERSRSIRMSEDDRERQRRSWAYGTAKLENEDITRELIDEAARKIERSVRHGGGSRK